MYLIFAQATTDSTIVTTLLGGGAIGAVITIVTRYWLDSKKQSDTQELSIAGLLEARLTKVELGHEKCMEDHNKANYERGIYAGQIVELRAQVSDLSKAVNTNAVALAKVAP